MKINKIGHHHSHDTTFYIQRPNGSGDYLLLLVFTPSQIMLKGVKQIIKEPFFILYEKSTPQMYSAYQDIYTDDYIHLSLNSQDLMLLTELRIPMDTPIALEDMNDLSKLIQEMTYEFYSTHGHREENLRLYLRLFFNKLSEILHPGKHDNPHFFVFNRIRSSIYNEPYTEHSIDSLAAKANVSRSSFQHIYKELFGISATSDIIKARTDYACYLLSSTRLPVSQIADMCGYHSEIHFMRQFKQKIKKTPSEYRKGLTSS
ncbi:MAG: helix-turn-helix transcriptional regulator [Lachnospiraceae bacterium]|nr:helix-turn-helix transcriptional regulator [Lachnospiraceae bacterium]